MPMTHRYVLCVQGKKGLAFQSPLVNQCVMCVDLEATSGEGGAMANAASMLDRSNRAITGKPLDLIAAAIAAASSFSELLPGGGWK